MPLARHQLLCGAACCVWCVEILCHSACRSSVAVCVQACLQSRDSSVRPAVPEFLVVQAQAGGMTLAHSTRLCSHQCASTSYRPAEPLSSRAACQAARGQETRQAAFTGLQCSVCPEHCQHRTCTASWLAGWLAELASAPAAASLSALLLQGCQQRSSRVAGSPQL